ncbi:response regulator, partial [Planktotalea sp.]|uniref:response regulator n=1 Tax=Planktotalea sp. TaxID=2029877 RepID=UPI003F6AA930
MAKLTTMRITLVEDNMSLAKGITYRLEDAGHAVDRLHDGSAAETHLMDDGADLVILDINLPGVDGLTLLTAMRKRGDVRPVILLTARADTQDRVKGLDAGADDYLIKPFEMAELEARVRALLRRRAIPQQVFRSIGAGFVAQIGLRPISPLPQTDLAYSHGT